MSVPHVQDIPPQEAHSFTVDLVHQVGSHVAVCRRQIACTHHRLSTKHYNIIWRSRGLSEPDAGVHVACARATGAQVASRWVCIWSASVCLGIRAVSTFVGTARCWEFDLLCGTRTNSEEGGTPELSCDDTRPTFTACLGFRHPASNWLILCESPKHENKNHPPNTKPKRSKTHHEVVFQVAKCIGATTACRATLMDAIVERNCLVYSIVTSRRCTPAIWLLPYLC